MTEPTSDVRLWMVSPPMVGTVRLADPALADDDELLEAIWAAAHEPWPVHEWAGLRARSERPDPATVLYVEEAEVLVYADAFRLAVEGVRSLSSDHTWYTVTIEAGGRDRQYWLLWCGVPDVALPDGSVDHERVRGASVVHYQVGDNFPVFDDGARGAVEAACPEVVFVSATA